MSPAEIRSLYGSIIFIFPKRPDDENYRLATWSDVTKFFTAIYPASQLIKEWCRHDGEKATRAKRLVGEITNAARNFFHEDVVIGLILPEPTEQFWMLTAEGEINHTHPLLEYRRAWIQER